MSAYTSLILFALHVIFTLIILTFLLFESDVSHAFLAITRRKAINCQKHSSFWLTLYSWSFFSFLDRSFVTVRRADYRVPSVVTEILWCPESRPRDTQS